MLSIAYTNDTNYTNNMPDTKPRPPQALQAVLSRKNIEITCALVFEDESITYPRVDSVSVRGAQREITGGLVAYGYVPVGRWADDGEDEDGYREWSRPFKPGEEATSDIYIFPGS
jgi:hypothetical protein